MEQPFHQMFSVCRDANAPAAAFIVSARQYDSPSQLSVIINDVRQNEQGTKFVTYREALNLQLSVHPL